MTTIEIYTIATFMFVFVSCVVATLRLMKHCDAMNEREMTRKQSITRYTGKHYNRHGNQID